MANQRSRLSTTPFSTSSPPRIIPQPLLHPQDPTKGFIIQSLMGAQVRFGPGAEVTRVSLSTDFKAIRIWDIDTDASIESIWKGLAAISSYDAHQLQIFVREGTRGTIRFADLAANDRYFAQNICRGFQEIDQQHGTLLSDDVQEIPSFIPWLPARQYAVTDSCTLLLTWRKPTRTATLMFRDGRKARELACLVHDRLIKTFDRHVRAEVIPMPCSRTAVELSGLPIHLSHADVVKRIPQDLTPNWIGAVLQELADLTALTERLESIGPLASDLCPQNTADERMTSATVRFVDEADARRAIRKYNDTVLPFQRSGVLHVEALFKTKFVIPYRWINNPAAPLGRVSTNYPQVNFEVFDHAFPETISLEVTSTDKSSAVQVRRILESHFEVDASKEEEYAHMLEDALSLQDDESSSESHCSVCMTEPTDPIQSSCGHVYCLDCYTHLTKSAAVSVTDTAIKCIGNIGSCQKPFPLSELRAVLPTVDYRRLLESSLTSYVRRSPLKLRNCPTAGCQQLYRPTPKKANVNPVARCPGCLVVLCSACHAQHEEDVSCEKAEDDANTQLRKALNIKGCPQCGTFLERTGGCNHLKCESCHTHICWVCMSHYPESLACYEHMRDTHGGAYAGIPGYDVFGERIRDVPPLLPGVELHLEAQVVENFYGHDGEEEFEDDVDDEDDEEGEYGGPGPDVEGQELHE
ncbi:ATP-dependent RNA helicase DEAH12, chloroplastic [Colletotrichum spaethianum]|uniref:RBR-type E3 ubiquitin transferase n=1 Tax=Colletotrichum spaethianum TaxID=700344 RepID=A0AA37P023_9PEZI|nr:ATP-dependent RNA helicase DEAH12, chloroplastic [Colletotrichum spaethianum]GKT42983.1 ATP-dependent RNA helicase DEAH12, chloroplastic [Colletotrichum spaethianum]